MAESTRSISIALVISGLGPGGSERVITLLANYWANLDWRVTVLALDSDCTPPYFQLVPGIDVRRLDLLTDSRSFWAALGNTIRRLRVLRSELHRVAPDVVLSFGDRTNILSLLAGLWLPMPIAVAERSDPGRQYIGRFWSWMRRITYPRAAAVIAQTDAAMAHFRGLELRARAVIGNPITVPDIAFGANGTAIVGVGRMTPEKGFDRLIDGFARVASKHPNWSLAIYGDGPERPVLQRRIKELLLEDRIRLPGLTTKHGQWLAEAGVFVLPSRHEGFPNALGEALAAGLPAVAFDCDSGPREMIEDGYDGLLVPEGDITAMSTALDRLLSDPDLRARLGTAARQSMRRFRPGVVLERWTELIANIAGDRT